MRNLLTMSAMMMMLTGCWGNKSTGSGPEEALETFYKNLFSGDFTGAGSLCDTLGMKEYIGNIRNSWNKADSSVMTIVPAILSETEVTITETMKEGQERIIFYKLTATDGTDKEKIAILRNEEGAWKITEITDRN